MSCNQALAFFLTYNTIDLSRQMMKEIFKMRHIAIVAGGPTNRLPQFEAWQNKIDAWIGADRGAYLLSQAKVEMIFAVGDFDSVTTEELMQLKQYTKNFEIHPVEKDATDLEIAIEKAIAYQPDKIYLFGVTGGRLDHELINLQLLERLSQEKIPGVIVDHQNEIELYTSGQYTIENDPDYLYYSFIPYTEKVRQLTLKNFKYGLENYDLLKGSTRCVSNELPHETGEFSFIDGLLYLIKSKG